MKHSLPPNLLLRISFLLVILAAPAGAIPPRTNINPALLYWQAFSLFPDTKGTNVYGLQDDASGLVADWTKRAPNDADRKLAHRFEGAFKLLHRATRTSTPCDWGLDLADGPEAVLPNLIKSRTAVQAAVLRARVALEDRQPLHARDELLTALTLGRRIALDGALVQVMIQAAVEGMVVEFIANHFDRFDVETLQQLSTGLDLVPRVSVETGMATERAFFYDWLLTQIEEFRRAGPDDAAVLPRCQALLARAFDTQEDRAAMARKLVAASGHTTAGLIAYVKEIEPIYTEMSALARATPDQVATRTKEFGILTTSHTNLLVNLMVPNVGRSRQKELELLARLQMFRAACAYRVQGQAGLEKVTDPFGHGPFSIRETKDKLGRAGFELRSELSTHGLNGTLFFVNGSQR